MATTDATQNGETTEETQVLTFTLGDTTYCVAIEYVAEVVDGGELTDLPETEDHVEGVMDLRGTTTTIVNPSKILETDTRELVADGGNRNHRIVVLDSETVAAESSVGWLVSDVNEVTAVTDELVDTDPIGDTDFLRGLISEDDGFTIWLNPSQLVA